MYTTQESMNIQLGQHGAAFNNGTDALTPPDGLVIVAIQMCENGTSFSALVSENSTQWFNTAAAAHSDTNGDTFEAALTFVQGFTMYGRWTSATLDAGSAIYYFGS
tara:strand:+ start:319 stop:636 length:318 start_codon:yes stop_codon:yes gene_type:complete